MISFVKGTIDEVGADCVVVDVGGVGFEVVVSQDTVSKLPPQGSEVKLYTYFNVTQDSYRLYGFPDRESLSVFKRLITISGLGPKGGQAILSVMTPDELRFAVVSGNAKAITKAPGVGKRIADRIILELKDKFSDDELTSGISGINSDGKESGIPEGDPAKEATEALIALGYGAQEALRAVRAALNKNASLDTGDLLKAALKEF